MQRRKMKEKEEEDCCYDLRRKEDGFHFFKIISPMQQDQGIMIPKKFIRTFGKELSDVAVLKVPSSKEWEVELRKDEGQVWFQNGWQEFAEYHSVCGWHFLVFRYDGNSQFSVVICDMSTSEIEYPCDAEDLKEPSNEKGSPTSSEREQEKVSGVCPSKHVMGEFTGRKTHYNCNTALPQPHFSLGSIASKKNETMQRLSFPRKRKLLSSQSNITGCIPSLGAIQEDAPRKKRESLVKNRVEQEGNQESQLMLGKNAANDIPKLNFQRNEETATSFTLTEVISNHTDEKIHVTKNMNSKQNSDYYVQDMQKKRDFSCNRVTDKIRLEESEIFGSIFNIKLTGDSECLADCKQTMSSIPGSQLIRSCNADQHQVKQMGGMLKSPSSHLYNGIKSDSRRNTVNPKRVDLESDSVRQEARTTVFSIPQKRHVELLSEHRRPLSVHEKEQPTLAAKSFTSKNPFFSVRIRYTHINHCTMNLPKTFANAYLKEKFQTVTLQVSDGRMWQVNCSTREHSCRLFKGWRAFVLDNHLVEDDICIFELLDKKHKKLKVSIFRVFENHKQQNGILTKSESPSHKASCIVKSKGKQTEDHGKKRRFSHSLQKKKFEQIRNYEQAVASSPDFRLTRASGDKLHQRMNMEAPPEPYSAFLDRGVHSNTESNNKKIKTGQVYMKAETKTTELQVQGEKRKIDLVEGIPVLNQVEERPILAANAFTSANPFCTVTMRPSFVSRCYKLGLPMAFARTYLKNNTQAVTLQVPDGRTWQVNSSSLEFYNRLVKGWRKFVLDNHLEEDDTCIFELIDKKPCKLKVNIFRAPKDPNEKNGFAQSKSPRDNLFCLVENKGKPEKYFGKKRKLPDLKESNKSEQMRNKELEFIIHKKDALITSASSSFTSSYLEENKKRKFLPSVDSEYVFSSCVGDAREGAADDSHHTVQERSEELNVVKGHTNNVSRVQWPMANQVKERSITAATKFTSKNPFCTVTMRHSYVHNSFGLNLPAEFARKYLKDATNGVTLRLSDRGMWHARHNIGDYRKLSSGWRAFVLDNHLEEDDVCIFELVDKNDLEMIVHIFRVRKLQLCA